MPLPLLEKNYYMDVNRQVGHGTNVQQAFRNAMFAIKQGLKAGGCTVWGSSDGVSNWGNSGEDYWVDENDINYRSSSPYEGSWIVLNIPNGSQIMLAAAQYTHTGEMRWSSPGNFSGGGLNTWPTGTYYTWHDNYGIFTTGSSSAWLGRSNLWLSSDGDIFTYILAVTNRYRVFWFFHRLQDPVDNWDGYHIMYCVAQNTDTSYMSSERLGPGGNNNWRVWQSSGHRAGGLTTLGYSTGGPLNQETNFAINSWTGEYEMHRAGFYCEQLGYEGRHGRLSDFYFVNSALNNADTLENDPDNPTFDWAVFYEVALPWDGSGAPAMTY